ncbi:unnamed protein product [Trichobilharzia regenti]|nr:unnamed protein product [Trichobilharzia regenti]
MNEVGRFDDNFNDSATNPDFVDNSEISPDDTDENNIIESIRRSQLLASKQRHHYKYERRHSTCGGCGITENDLCNRFLVLSAQLSRRIDNFRNKFDYKRYSINKYYSEAELNKPLSDGNSQSRHF